MTTTKPIPPLTSTVITSQEGGRQPVLVGVPRLRRRRLAMCPQD
ncbi:MAG: hypothetical protein QF573_00685 [Chloroflexota bacterium]|nr:hypothetical protein [Chloroflexota bacterium]